MEIIEVSRTLEETSAKIEDMFLSLADKFSALLNKKGGTSLEELISALNELKESNDKASEKEDALFNGFDKHYSALYTNLNQKIEDLNELDTMVKEIKNDSEEMELITLNAMVISIKSGEKGLAFSCITENLKRLSNQMLQYANHLLTEEDELPQAYTDIEMERITQEANTLFGYMDNANKSMFFKKGIGVVIGQFKTFFSAKKNQWFLSRGVYKNGSWKHVSDLDGNKLYFKITESGEKIMTTEVTDMPVVKWEGSMMEGIFWSLKDLFSSLLNIHTKEGRARLKELMKDPVKLRNYMLATGDLFGALLFYMIATLLWGGLKDSEKSYIEKNLEKLLLSSSNELNLWKVFNGQIDFQFTGYVTVSKMASSFKNVITGDTNAQRALADNLGALSIFKSTIYDTYPVDNG